MPPYTLVRPFLRTSQGFLFDFGGPDYDGDGNPVSPGNFEVNIDASGYAVAENTATTGTITVTEPAAYAGVYPYDITNISSGPIEVVTPASTGTLQTGEIITGIDPLYLSEADGTTDTITYQWQRDTGGGYSNISGATGATLTAVQNNTAGDVRRVNSVTDENGTTVMNSPGVTIAAGAEEYNAIARWDFSDTGSWTASGNNVLTLADQTANNVDLVDASAVMSGSIQSTGSIGGLSAMQNNYAGTYGGLYTNGAGGLVLDTSGDLLVMFVVDITDDGISNGSLIELNPATGNVTGGNAFVNSGSGGSFKPRVQGSSTSTDLNGSVGNSAGQTIITLELNWSTNTVRLYGPGGTSMGSNTSYTTKMEGEYDVELFANVVGDRTPTGELGEVIITQDLSQRAAMYSALSTKWSAS